MYSTGTFQAANVHPLTIRVMHEIGIDISKNTPKDMDQFLSREFDHVITVCNNAKENCPVFYGEVKIKTHIGFDDPAASTGTEEEIIANFRRIRDEIKVKSKAFFENI